MFKFLKVFLVSIILYHILVTVAIYGLMGGIHPQIPALARDGIWIFSMIMIFSYYFDSLKNYLKTWKHTIFVFLLLIIFSIGISVFLGKGFVDIMIGFKYGLLYIMILIIGSALGYFIGSKPDALPKLKRFGDWIVTSILIIIAFGFVRQGFKLALPDIFMSIGYGPLDNFRFGDKPPLYYLTGLDGTLRWQGIFAGPNNYGYFLVAFFGIFLYWLQDRKRNIKKTFKSKTQLRLSSLFVLRICATIMTLSRTAYIGTILILAIFYRTEIKKYWKIGLGIFGIFILGIIGLSVIKGTSTLDHFSSTINSIKYVVSHPMGSGLGTSGPAIHHNGTILPENYFLQLMIDIGLIGFALYILAGFCIKKINDKISDHINSFKHSPNMRSVVRYRKGLGLGIVAMLVMGLFLHAFEDSMVIYRFFVIRGVFLGYLSNLTTTDK